MKYVVNNQSLQEAIDGIVYNLANHDLSDADKQALRTHLKELLKVQLDRCLLFDTPAQMMCPNT